MPVSRKNPVYLHFLATGFLIAGALVLTSCDDRSAPVYVSKERQHLQPADNAEQWLERLKLDISHGSTSSDFLTTLYSELPPIDQWPGIAEKIEIIANDKNLNKDRDFLESGNLANKLRIFSALLKDENADTEPLVRTIIKDSEIREYRYDDALSAMLIASKDPQATVEWLQKNKPELLTAKDDRHQREKEEPADWQKALAENQIDQGIQLLQQAISLEEDHSEKADLLQKLIEVAVVLDRLPLAKKATSDLTVILLKELETEPYVSNYQYDQIFKTAARLQDWQSILDTFAEILASSAKNKDSRIYHDFGKLDQIHSAYLTALYNSGDTGKFGKEIQNAQKLALNDPEEFFSMLAIALPGQPPLGILFVDFLKEAGDEQQASAYLQHLLARNPGVDALYEALIENDPALGKPFIESLRVYDPFEERPLIWLAEIARRGGDLKLAEETIQQAIALDPSDGDHGKDSRMFCYEILARIHKDAGRDELAAKFRSVVESIRQGEAADDFLHAGLIREATDRYRKALGKFEDAYCLQSRLALTLARNGKFDEAIVHFTKAFELMPISFGPRESHCFGCEGLFSDPRVIEIALPLLEAFEKEHPDNARAPYLLGLVLSEKDDPAQAILAYRRAFELDPEYFNAAQKLLTLLEKNPAKFAESLKLRDRIFEIAPYTEKLEYISGPSQLQSYWQLTSDFPDSPLDLPPIPFQSAEKEDRKDQYVERKDNSFGFNWVSDEEMAIDGWSQEELRRSNKFLKAIGEFD
ncbi:tetratricopeptide repeat protein [Luteolibacter sp. AS25]|uniref:tetratricopeptide repeat protein n=1 Tax=Luteolibacter sp. AS25 TaxID=3135776 RepID=UPI00398A58AF